MATIAKKATWATFMTRIDKTTEIIKLAAMQKMLKRDKIAKQV